MPLPKGTQLGPYEIVEPIGAGGMGEVYRARDPRVGRDVAIKISSAEFNERFDREARAVASLNHPNICTLYDVGPNYLVMELIEGPTLAERIAKGPLSLEESLKIGAQIGDALEAAHEKGVLHRDLKPGNIKIRPDGMVKVLDFGLAKVGIGSTSANQDSPTLTAAATVAGVILGTAGYMSPEQVRGETVDKRTDIWAYGVVLYEMLTGERLFEGKTMSDTLASVLRDEPRLDRVPGEVRKLLKACLERESSRRLRDIGDARRLLEESPANQTQASRPLMHALTWIGLAALALTLAAMSFVYLSQPSEKPASSVRLQITLPDYANQQMDLSPDGSKLLYYATAPNGRSALRVLSLDSSESRMLPGTEGISGTPTTFWSPDSRFVAFFLDGKLKKVGVGGGSPQTLCEIPVNRGNRGGGAWNEADILILQSAAGLVRVSLPDCDMTPLTMLDPARKEAHQLPRFLPGGRQFLYFRDGVGQSALFAGSLDASPEQQPAQPLLQLDRGDSVRVYFFPSSGSGAGHLVFRRGSTVMAQPFDPGRLAFTGEAVTIAEEAANSTASSDMLIIRDPTPAGTTQLAWFDRSGNRIGETGEAAARQYGINLSPDGTRVVIDAGGGETRHVSVVEFEGGRSTRFTTGSTTGTPIWSPNGNQMLFHSARNGAREVFIKASTGAGDEKLFFNEFPAYAHDWSKDGRYILLTGFFVGKGADIWVLPTEPGSKPRPYIATTFSEIQPQFSPEPGGPHWVAYTSDESGQPEVYVSSFPDPEKGKFPISKGGGNQPRWSRDGKEIFYISEDNSLISVAVNAVVGKDGPVFKASLPELVFKTNLSRAVGAVTTSWVWDVAPNGRFLLNTVVEQPVQPAVTAIINWQAALRKR